jgi:hypothetical protein
VAYDGPLFRIHDTGGRHPTRWDALRTYGPLDARWDPHPLPTGEHPAYQMAYAATDPLTPFGEFFQRTRVIDLSRPSLHLSGWRPSRQLRLLDLTGTWALRNGAAAALAQAPRTTCRSWSRAILDQLGADLDGLWTLSTITGRPTVALYGKAGSAFPAAPSISRPLNHEELVVVVEQARDESGFAVVL